MDPANDYEDTSDYNEMFLAVHNGDLSLVQSLLEKYSATETIRGRTLLHVAAARGHKAIAKLFIPKRDLMGDTPLHLAIRENQPVVFNLLLGESNLNADNCFYENPLHYAALYNRPEFAKTLIDNGALIDVTNHEAQTPLNVALDEGNVKVAEVLFEHGAVLSDNDLKTMRSLRFAVSEGNLEIVKLLMLKGCNRVDIPKDDVNSIKSSLKLAVSSHRLDILEYLMINGVKNRTTVNADELHLFRLMTTSAGSLSSLKCLVDLGFKTKEADYVFHSLLTLNCHEMWHYLLKCFSKINAKTYFKEKQLHSSIRMGQVESIKKILNEPTNEYKLNNFDKKLAVYIAAESGNDEILEVLLNASYPVDSLFKKISPLHVAATLEHPRLVKLLLKAGADVNLQTKDGLTPLYFAACAGQPAVVKFLLENGADPSKSCEISESPLALTMKFFFFIPTSRLMFERLVKVTETIMRFSKTEDLRNFIPYALGIRVSNINHPNPETEDIISDLDDCEFRPEIVRCLFNYLSDELVVDYSDIVINKSFPIEHTPELLHLLIEYNDPNWCFNIRIDHNDNNYKCQFFLTCYSRNIDDLLHNAKRIIWYNEIDEYHKDHLEDKIAFFKLIVSRLVLLTTDSYLPLIEFCLENDFNDWRKKCLEETIVMQRTKVNKNLKLTFYDVLTNSIDKVAGYTNNEDFLTAMKSSEEKFPIYAAFLKINVEMAERRRNFINDCVSLMV